MKSRQAWLVEPGRFEIREVDISPGPENVLVKVRVCGLCTWELNHWKGRLGDCPQTLGHEVAGTVVAVGDAVPPGLFDQGQAVTGFTSPMAGFADYAQMPHQYCGRLADHVRLDEALGEPLCCVLNTLAGASPQAGDVGVVVGCGPMGLWCIQALAGSTLAALIAVDVSQHKLQLCGRFGATETINPANENVIERIADISDGHMADFVIEATGQPAVLNQCADYLRTGRGRLVVMSSHETGDTPFDWRKIQQKGAIIHSTHPPYALDHADNIRRVCLLLNGGTFDSRDIISHRFDLEQIQEAFETLENRGDDYIKGVVDFGQ